MHYVCTVYNAVNNAFRATYSKQRIKRPQGNSNEQTRTDTPTIYRALC